MIIVIKVVSVFIMFLIWYLIGKTFKLFERFPNKTAEKSVLAWDIVILFFAWIKLIFFIIN